VSQLPVLPAPLTQQTSSTYSLCPVATPVSRHVLCVCQTLPQQSAAPCPVPGRPNVPLADGWGLNLGWQRSGSQQAQRGWPDWQYQAL